LDSARTDWRRAAFALLAVLVPLAARPRSPLLRLDADAVFLFDAFMPVPFVSVEPDE